MLILPLHRPLTRATFPFATALLILINVLVFLGWQAGDDAAMARAQQHYLREDIGRYEVPAYERHLLGTSQIDALDEFAQVPVATRAAYVAQRTLSDVAFVAALRSGELFDGVADHAAWQPLRAEYEAVLDEVFTLRHLLRSSEVEPWRMLSAAFLHGGAMHLVGNMLFLLALGLLVEGAIGSGRFLGVYLLGAIGASAASLLWRWGEAGGGLGASGAVAALMGAFCVVWGRQPVRFFYWDRGGIRLRARTGDLVAAGVAGLGGLEPAGQRRSRDRVRCPRRRHCQRRGDGRDAGRLRPGAPRVHSRPGRGCAGG